MRPASTGLRLFLTCWLVYALHFATNIVREHYPAFSLAERGTLRVDPYVGLHPDLFFLDGRGFINNNPGASILAAAPYALARPLVDAVDARVTAARAARGQQLTAEYDDPRPNRRKFFQQVRERGLDVRFGLASGVIQLGFTAPLSALAVVVMRAVLLRLGFAAAPALGLALLYAFGTPVFFRSGFLNQNLVVAHLDLFAFALLRRPGRAVPEPLHLLAAGFLAGYGVVCDYSGLVIALALGAWALADPLRPLGLRRALPRAGWMLAGGLAAGAILVGYQAWAFGDPWLPAQRYMPDTPLSGAGWHGLQLPALDLIVKNLASPQYGLFVAGPLLLAAFLAPRRPGPRGPALSGAERALVFGGSLALLLFASSISYARLQWNTGVRYLMPAVPFLFLAAATALVRWPRRVALGVAGLAIFQSWTLAMVREDPLPSLVAVCVSGLQLPWLSVLGKMGDQYLGFLGSARPDPTWLLALAGFGIALVWWPLQSPAPARDEKRSGGTAGRGEGA